MMNPIIVKIDDEILAIIKSVYKILIVALCVT